MINIYINNAYPTTDELHIHELNTNGSLKRVVAFWDYNEALDLTGKTVTATLVINGELIAEDISCTKIEGETNAVELDLTSNNNYTLIPGKMLVEFKMSDSGDKDLYPAVAMVVIVHASARDNAQVTDRSYGTVSEILQEVATARGNFSNLNARFANNETNIADVENRTSALENEFPIDTEDIKDYAVTEDKLAPFSVTDGKIDGGAVGHAQLKSNAVESENVKDGEIGYEKLDGALQNFVDDGVTCKVSNINSLADIDTPEFCDSKVIYMLKLGYSASVALGNHFNAVMRVVPREITGATVYDREITFPKEEGLKYVQTVTNRTVENFATDGDFVRIEPSPKITVWDYATSQANDFTVPTSFVGKLGDIVVITTGTGTGGKIFTLSKIVTSAGNSQYFWKELANAEDLVKPKGLDSFINMNGKLTRVVTEDYNNTTGNPDNLVATIPSEITEISNCCFQNNYRLKYVELPNGLLKIGYSAFRDSGIESIVIPNSVTEILNDAFCDCEKLSNVTLSTSLNKIAESLFYGCKSLTGITIPASVIIIERYAFRETGLESIIIPHSVTEIRRGAFLKNYGLVDITLGSVEIIGDGAFMDCISIENISIPNTVNSIYNWAFAHCFALITVDLTAFTDPSDIPSLLGTDAFVSNASGRKFIVANETMKAAFSSATNWSYYASDFEVTT